MKIDSRVGSIHIKLDSKRIDKNLLEAQKKLNEQIVADCTPLIPFQQGALRGSVNYPQGIYGGEIEWNTPYAHYQYMGEVYGPNIPKYDDEGHLIGYWSPPKKYPTGRELQQHEPGTTDHWFEVAKAQHKDEWIDLVKRTAGKE